MSNPKKEKNKTRFCAICGREIKPVGGIKIKGNGCIWCAHKSRSLTKLLKETYPDAKIKGKKIPASELLYIKETMLQPEENVFKYCEQNPNVLLKVLNQNNKTERKALLTLNYEEMEQRKKEKVFKRIDPIPYYIILSATEEKEILYVEGDYYNPNITFRCRRCGKEVTTYSI